MSLINSTIIGHDVQRVVITDASSPFDHPDADVIIRSSDNIDFRVFKLFLSFASPVFKDMFTLPQVTEGNNLDETKDGLPIVQVTEDGETLKNLFLLCYPVDGPVLDKLGDVLMLLEAASKYSIERAQKRAQEWLIASRFMERHAMLVFSVACRYGLEKEARLAAKATLYHPICKPSYGKELNFMTAGQLYQLIQYHWRCVEAMKNVATNFTWIRSRSFCWFECEAEAEKRLQKQCAGRWWYAYMSRVARVLAVQRLGEAQGRELLKVAAGDIKCGKCHTRVLSDMKRFNIMFEAKIDRAISEVSLFVLEASSHSLRVNNY